MGGKGAVIVKEGWEEGEGEKKGNERREDAVIVKEGEGGDEGMREGKTQ